MTLRQRFMGKVSPEPNSGCWLWTGAVERTGYAKIATGSTKDASRQWRLAHRVAYELFVGPIPPGLQLDHLCRVRSCVNPTHLEPVTRLENVRRGDGGAHWRIRTHCKNGHEFTKANTHIRKSGARGCKICERAWSRDWTEKNIERKREIDRNYARRRRQANVN